VCAACMAAWHAVHAWLRAPGDAGFAQNACMYTCGILEMYVQRACMVL
jgi:hypothetical protein